jgi:hypothetical protein
MFFLWLDSLTIASSEQEAASTLVLTLESDSRCLLSLTQALAKDDATLESTLGAIVSTEPKLRQSSHHVRLY